MTPRPRRTGYRDLPANLYHNKSTGAYIYRNPVTGKRHGMGNNKQAAITAAKKLNLILVPSNNIVDRVLGVEQSLNEFLDYYIEHVMPEKELAKATQDLYIVRIKQIREELGDKPISEITVLQVANFLDSLTARSANQTRALLVDVINHAVAKGLCPDNPAALTMPRKERKARKRHTAEGIKAIYEAAEPWLKNAIDLALLTAQRREEIVAMRFDDIKDGALHIVQKKTRKSDAGWLRMPLTPQLKEVIARCRDHVPSPYLIHRIPERKVKRKDGLHWTAVTPDYLTKAFKKARDDAGCYKHLSEEEQPTFHELRAYSLHLYKKAGRNAQTIAGHTTSKTTKNYQADHDEIIWTDAIADLDLSKVTQ